LPRPSPDDDRQALQDWHDGQTRGVVGSPHFFLVGGDVFCPTLEINRTDGRLHITIDEEMLPSFYEQALGV
jgi:hypothetical protein